jgi:pimeloyl-ACP methyl ester carboxylesterase
MISQTQTTHHPEVRTVHWLAVRVAAVLLAAVFTLIVSCSSDPVAVPADQMPGPLPPSIGGFIRPGPHPAVSTEGSIPSAYGCTLEYRVYEPEGWEGQSRAPTVILAHGFMRDLSAMQGWAEHWATHGVRTVVVSFCNSSWLNGRHDRNAEDLVAVARAVSGEDPDAPVIYAGFSAGGLAALLAAEADTRAIAYLGLDAVDSGDLAADAVDSNRAGLPQRSLFLFGEPSSCNADGNMVPVARRTAAAVVRVPYATHCDFENPYDPRCARLCGTVVPPEAAEEIRVTIRALATAWVVDAAGGPERIDVDALADLLARLERAGRVRDISLD